MNVNGRSREKAVHAVSCEQNGVVHAPVHDWGCDREREHTRERARTPSNSSASGRLSLCVAHRLVSGATCQPLYMGSGKMSQNLPLFPTLMDDFPISKDDFPILK